MESSEVIFIRRKIRFEGGDFLRITNSWLSSKGTAYAKLYDLKVYNRFNQVKHINLS